MTNLALLAYIVSAAAWLFAAGMLVLLYLRGRAETRFFRSLSGGDDAAAPSAPSGGQGGPLAGVYDGPLKWPGPVLPPFDAPIPGGLHGDWTPIRITTDTALSGLARHEAAQLWWEGCPDCGVQTVQGPSAGFLAKCGRRVLTPRPGGCPSSAGWTDWHDYRKRATGGDDESGEPWRAGE